MKTRPRPIGITILAILAAIAAIVSFYHTLQYLGLLPFSLGPLDFFGVSLLGAIFSGLVGLIYIWVTLSLWNLRPEGWLFSVAISVIGLIFAVLAIIGQSTLQALLPAIIIYGVILLYCLRPGIRDAFTPASSPSPAMPPPAEAVPVRAEPAAEAEAASAESSALTSEAAAGLSTAAASQLASTETSPPTPPVPEPQDQGAGEDTESTPPMAEETEMAQAEPSGPASTSHRKTRVDEIEGIGSTYAATLAGAGIRTTEDLLEAGGTPAGRERIAQETGLSHVNLLKWINMADLMRVPGIGEEYSQLLEIAGVDTVKELRTRNPVNLHKTLLDASGERDLVRRPPSLAEVESWVEAATQLDPKISY